MSAIKANSAAILAPGDKAKRAVVRVGGVGRGFVVEGRGNERYVVTAAHCLPRMPQPYGFSRLEELTYRRLLAPLGGEPSVSCLCLFVDPISDLTVLGMPDDLEPDEEAETYEELVAAAIPLVVAEPPREAVEDMRECRAFLLSLSDRWFPCTVQHYGDRMVVSDAAEDIVGGMAGSPIVSENGSAVGVLCLSFGGYDKPHRVGGVNPQLMGNLPSWFLKMLAKG